MYLYIIGGSLLIALGTILIWYGGQLQNKKSNKEITTKIEEVNTRLETIKNDTTATNKKDEITKIKNEFDTWAEEFKKEKKLRKIDFEKIKISKLEEELRYNKKWRPFVKEFISIISNIVEAYNKKTNSNVEINFQELPENICTNKFVGSIKFANNKYWLILISDNFSNYPNGIPSIWISIEKSIITYMLTNSIRINTPKFALAHNADKSKFDKYFSINNNTSIMPDSEIFNDFPISEFKKRIADALKLMFEYQIHLLEENN